MDQMRLGNGHHPFQVCRAVIELQDFAVASVAKRHILCPVLALMFLGIPAWCDGAKPDRSSDQETRSARPSPNRPDSARPKVTEPPPAPQETRRPRTPDCRPAPHPNPSPVQYKIRYEERPPAPVHPHRSYVPIYYDPFSPVGMTKEEAMDVAEAQTGGQAVSVRRIDLNGATGGYEVIVRMPGKEKGWRVVIDIDTRHVKNTYPIPSPEESRDMPEPQEEVRTSDSRIGESVPAPVEPPKAEFPQPKPSAPGNRLYGWRNSKNIICITDYPPPEGARQMNGD